MTKDDVADRGDFEEGNNVGFSGVGNSGAGMILVKSSSRESFASGDKCD